MEIKIIRKKIKDNEYVYSLHAEIERKADALTFHQIEKALLNGEILEDYPDTGRGESCTQTTKVYRSLDKGEKVWKRRNVIFAEVQNTNNEGQIIYIPIRGITYWSQIHLWKSAKTAEWSIMMPVS